MAMEIYIVQSGKKEGPFSMEEILQLLEKGTINTQTLAWHKDLKDWEPLGRLIQEAQQEKKEQVVEEKTAAETKTPLSQTSGLDKETPTDPFLQLLKTSQQIAFWMEEELALYGTKASHSRSHPLEATVWLEYRLEFPHPKSKDIIARSSVRFQFIYTPFRQFEQEVDITMVIMERKKHFRVVDPSQEHVKQIVKTILMKYPDVASPFSLCHFHKKRAFPWQLWLEKNKLVRLKSIDMMTWVRLLWILGLLLVPYYGVGLLFLLSGWFLYQSSFHNGSYVLRSAWPSLPPLSPKSLLLFPLLLKAKASALSLLKERLETDFSQSLPPSIEKLPAVYESFFQNKLLLFFRLSETYGFIELKAEKEDLQILIGAYENQGKWTEKISGYGKDLFTGSLCILVEPKADTTTELQKSAMECETLASFLYSYVIETVEKHFQAPIQSLGISPNRDFQKHDIEKETTMKDIFLKIAKWIFPF
jgi:hypothetical protein